MPPAVSSPYRRRSRMGWDSLVGIRFRRRSASSAGRSARISAASSGGRTSNRSEARSGSSSLSSSYCRAGSTSLRLSAAVSVSRRSSIAPASSTSSCSRMSAISAGCRSASFDWLTLSCTLGTTPLTPRLALAPANAGTNWPVVAPPLTT